MRTPLAFPLLLALGACAADVDDEDLVTPDDDLPAEELVAQTAAPDDPAFQVLSYNINNPGEESPYTWPERRPSIVRLIRDVEPGIFGVQEARKTPAADPPGDLIAAFTTGADALYDVEIPTTFDGGAEDFGSYRAIPKLIFFRKGRFTKTSAPHDAVRLLVDEADPCRSDSVKRSFAWVTLRDERSPTKQAYFVVNTHLSAGDCASARNQEARLIQDAIEELNTDHLPILVMGDFNDDPQGPNASADDRPVTIMEARRDFYRLRRADRYTGTTPTAHATHLANWPDDPSKRGRLDYIFASRRLEVRGTGVVDGKYGFRVQPSDHMAITATLAMPR